jgi:hypothetical protein
MQQPLLPRLFSRKASGKQFCVYSTDQRKRSGDETVPSAPSIFIALVIFHILGQLACGRSNESSAWPNPTTAATTRRRIESMRFGKSVGCCWQLGCTMGEQKESYKQQQQQAQFHSTFLQPLPPLHQQYRIMNFFASNEWNAPQSFRWKKNKHTSRSILPCIISMIHTHKKSHDGMIRRVIMLSSSSSPSTLVGSRSSNRAW